jgi:hypothetical protein
MLTVITAGVFDPLQRDGVRGVSEFDNDVERKELRPDHILITDTRQWHFTDLISVRYKIK